MSLVLIFHIVAMLQGHVWFPQKKGKRPVWIRALPRLDEKMGLLSQPFQYLNLAFAHLLPKLIHARPGLCRTFYLEPPKCRIQTQCLGAFPLTRIFKSKSPGEGRRSRQHPRDEAHLPGF